MAASGEQAALGQLGQEATCPLCLDFFEQPMVLSCGHNFCRDCLAQLGTEPSCPQCRAKVEPGSACPNWALANIVGHLKRLQLSEGADEESSGHGLCQEHGQPLEIFCSSEKSLLCPGCFGGHQGHRLLSLPEAAQEYKLQCQRRVMCWARGYQECPDVPERFDEELCVLGIEGFTTGWNRWKVLVQEVENVPVQGRARWAIGVAKESVCRKGSFEMSPREGIWAVGKNVEGEIVAFSEVQQRLRLQSRLKTLRVSLDYEAEKVEFLDVETEISFWMGPLHGETLRPFFYLGHKGIFLISSL